MRGRLKTVSLLGSASLPVRRSPRGCPEMPPRTPCTRSSEIRTAGGSRVVGSHGKLPLRRATRTRSYKVPTATSSRVESSSQDPRQVQGKPGPPNPSHHCVQATVRRVRPCQSCHQLPKLCQSCFLESRPGDNSRTCSPMEPIVSHPSPRSPTLASLLSDTTGGERRLRSSSCMSSAWQRDVGVGLHVTQGQERVCMSCFRNWLRNPPNCNLLCLSL